MAHIRCSGRADWRWLDISGEDAARLGWEPSRGRQPLSLVSCSARVVRLRANAPENGSFSVNAGSIYYANNPFYLIGDGTGNDHNIIVPSTFAGRYFNIYWGRSQSIYNPFQYKIFSLYSLSYSFYIGSCTLGTTPSL